MDAIRGAIGLPHRRACDLVRNPSVAVTGFPQMRSETFDFVSNFSTLWQVILGAFLATGGGLVANQLEWRAQTRRRERNAALFFGEVLSSFAMILKRADETKKI